VPHWSASQNEGLPLSSQFLANKDEVERPIPTAWRGVLQDIVEAFVAGDYRLERGIASVEPVSTETAVRIAGNLRDFGATLVALPEATWISSVCIWFGDHWDALIDLWTRDEGPSDLVLHVRVADASPGFYFKIHLVYVP
jgi:hypothetical protein